MTKFLITGVAGFVGRYMVEYLQENTTDSQILGVDIAEQFAANIAYQPLNLLNQKEVHRVIGDFKPDYIIHLASISSVALSWQNPQECFQNNTSIMFNLLNAVAQHKLNTRVLSIGSSEEYGKAEDEAVPFDETIPLNPQNPYAVAKVSQEMIGRLYAGSFGVDVVMTRSFNHIGPRQNERFVVPSFIKQLVGISRGEQSKMLVGNIEVARDFLDVRDVVNAYFKILTQGKSGEVYNVCSGVPHQLKSIIETAGNLLNIKPEIEINPAFIRPNDTMMVWGNNQKLRAELAWQPRYTFNQTIKDIVAYWQSKPKD